MASWLVLRIMLVEVEPCSPHVVKYNDPLIHDAMPFRFYNFERFGEVDSSALETKVIYVGWML